MVGVSKEDYTFMIDTLDRINNKMDAQQKEIKDISIAITKLIAVDVEIREIKESAKRAWNEIDKIKEVQETKGCPIFRQFQAEHDNELQHNLTKISNFEQFRKDITTEVEALKMKPAKKWEHLSTVFITAIVAILVSFIALKLGVK